MTDDRWALVDAWPMANGRWSMADGRLPMADGRRPRRTMADINLSSGWLMADMLVEFNRWPMVDGRCAELQRRPGAQSQRLNFINV
jgi:hypothetical protein